MANAVVKIGKMASTNVDSLLESVQINADVANGSHVVLGNPVAGMLGVYTATAPVAVTTDEVLIVEAPVLVEINGYRIDVEDPTQFINKANRSVRARHLKVSDELTLTIDGFTAAPTVGAYAVPVNAGYKLAPAADLTGNTALAYKVVARNDLSIGQGFVEAYTLRVVKAN